MSESHITDDWLEVESTASVMSLDSLPSDDEVEVDDDDHAPISPAKPSPPVSAPAKKASPPASPPGSAPAKEASRRVEVAAMQQRISQQAVAQQHHTQHFDAPIPRPPTQAPMAIAPVQLHLLDTPIPYRVATAPMAISTAQQSTTQQPQHPTLGVPLPYRPAPTGSTIADQLKPQKHYDTQQSQQSNSQQHQTKQHQTQQSPDHSTHSLPLPAEALSIPRPPASEPDIYSANDDAEAPPRPSFDKEDEANVNDPSYYYKSLCAASNSLSATIERATQLGASRISTLSFLKAACDDLAKHVGDLKPIMAVYAKRWQAKGSGMAAGEMPVNASLLEWISTLRKQLLNAQAEMNRIRVPVQSNDWSGPDGRLTAKQIPLYLNVALAGCTEALEDTLTTIEEFMPIFKADFDESQTRWMCIPPKETETQKPPPSLKRPRPDLPHPDITRIRRELYSLKDQVRRSHVFLSTLYDTFPRPPLPEAPAVINTMNGIIEAISTILTNHASEWIESSYSPSPKTAIPYHEFVALDPDMLHDITGHLQELQDQLEVGEEQLIGTHSPEVLRNHQLVLLTECGHLGEIVSILDLLESLVLVRNTSTPR
ncbi:hypothetical protein B0J13DRAFT_566973 [Dactylonectria estremocensis]|uniref:Uncharacterized protein n=1 Tax=Dactylonectria estremocensis TaxID=1079267 RepID=A0A9P9DMR4_9HYPO|nr:hypothetical protein B0J13DRAFT_566973 [Dactylonectria estremocensis]